MSFYTEKYSSILFLFLFFFQKSDIQRILDECSYITEFIKFVGEKVGCKAVPSILSVLPGEVNKFNEKKDNKQCLLDTPSTVMANKEYKGHTKWLSLIGIHFAKNIFWHDTSSCTCSLYLSCMCKVSESFSRSSRTS